MTHYHRTISLPCVVFLALFVNSTKSYGDTRTQNFTTDPGWAAVGSGANGNSFGYQPASSFAGGASGEGGGTFTRNPRENLC